MYENSCKIYNTIKTHKYRTNHFIINIIMNINLQKLPVQASYKYNYQLFKSYLQNILLLHFKE